MLSKSDGRAYLRAIARDATSDCLKLVCPFCDGGSTGETSLSLSMLDTGVFYMCHRASCGARGCLEGSVASGAPGFSRISSTAKPEHQVPGIAKLVDLHGPPVRPVAGNRALDRFSAAPRGPLLVDPVKAGLWTDSDYGSLEIWECKDLHGIATGWQTRANWPKGKLVRTYKMGPDSVLCYSLPSADSTTLMIVEDPLSAVVARGWGMASLALMGTYLHPGTATMIADWLSRQILAMNVIVALDPGAEEQASRVQRTLQGYTMAPVGVLYLRDDLKNMSVGNVRKIANSITGLDL